MTTLPENSIPTPATPPEVTADVIMAGPPVPKIERLRLFSHRQWEDLITEWLHELKTQYAQVSRCAGAGDMGRDVIARVTLGGTAWDNYQCKHYQAPLAPSDVWVEIGKLVYYTKRGDYTIPRKYRFVAPQGAGTKLTRLLEQPDKLKSQFLQNWDAHCRTKIVGTAVDLDDGLRTYIDALDFSIFDAPSPFRILDDHSKTPWHVARFGGGLPSRPEPMKVPEDPTAEEARYVGALLEAYAEHVGRPISNISDIPTADLLSHLQDSRMEFYSAETLRTFSRDTLPGAEFETLQNEVLAGVKDTLRDEHADGYVRVRAVCATARGLQITNHPLVSRMVVRDRGGICHQLANDGRLRWKR